MNLSRPAGLLIATLSTVSALPEKTLTPQELAFFEKKVRPVLVEACYECHSAANKTKGGLRLDSRDAILHGGDSGEVIVPGNPKESLFITAIRHLDDDLKMPKKEKLSDQQIADLTKWVAMGAPDPRAEESGPAMIVADIDYEEGRKFWAFQPPVKRSAPEVKNGDWPRTEVDRYLLAAMEAKGLQPVSDAGRRTLIRRIYFDLLGLPPTAAQVERFLNDESPHAVETLVDELLASPHFGERWGRHWLDVARYSESNGMERNFTYPYAWRYRDYVIAAFNKDKPYDQFIREQIAGDLLNDQEAPHTDRTERAQATGFLALGPKILNERDKETFKMEMVDEQIDATSRAVLGLTVSCARCHDHKFDPIGTRDYYAIAGIFASTRTLFGTKGGGGNRQATDLMPLGEASPKLEAERKEFRSKLTASQKRLATTQKQLSKLRKQTAAAKGPKKKSTEQRLEEMRDKMNELKGEIGALRKNAPPLPDYAMGVAETDSPADCRICLRGDPKKRGPVVERGFLQVMHSDSAPPIGDDASGRKELANWMVSPDNPLAARVMVNRIWYHLFGTGIVRTNDNFGKMGERPVHPELLDHLALRFMENGWSMKKAIRELMLSRAYQLSGEHHAGNYEVDPENRHHWQMSHRRLEAEAIRDAILLASGQLDPRPYQGSPVQELGDVNFGQKVSTLGKGADAVRNHRSVYLPIIRNAVPQELRVFDFAEPSLIVGRRNVTTVPTQALYLLNDPFVLEHSAHIAQRLITTAKEDERRVDLAYATILSRPATTLEREKALALVSDLRNGLADAKTDERERLAWATLSQSLIASAEFRYLD